MKTIARILFIILSTIIFSNCSEDIYLHDGKDGAVGPQGPQGPEGDQGFSTLVYFDEITQTKVYYLDRDISLTFTMLDSILYQETKEGLRLTQIDECMQISEIVGVVVIDSFLVCNGEDGEIGPQGPQGPEGQEGPEGPQGEPGTPGQDGQDGTDGIDGTNGQDGQPGQNGENGKTIFVYPPFMEDCNNPGNSPYYREVEKWFVRDAQYLGIYSFNNIDAPNGNGTMVLDDYTTKGLDTIWSPEFSEPTAIDYFSCDIGSKGTWKVELFFHHKNGKTTFVQSEEINSVNNFVWYDLNSYQQEFIYEVDINNVKYQDVVRFGLVVTKIGDFSIPQDDWKNHTFHADNFYVHRIKFYNI